MNAVRGGSVFARGSLAVRDVFLIEIRDIERPVGSVGDEDRTEGFVVALEREAGVSRREGRAHAGARTDNDIVMERVGIEKRAEIMSRQGGAFGDGEEVREPGNF